MVNRLISVAVLTSCSTTSSPGEHLTPAQTPLMSAEELVGKARTLDYAAPMEPHRQALRERAADAYLAACAQEHLPTACIWTISLSTKIPGRGKRDHERASAAASILVPLCIGGNDDACHTFTSPYATDLLVDPVDACGKGLGDACATAAVTKGPEAKAQLEARACELGVPSACRARAEAETASRDQWLGRARRAAERGCARGFTTHCLVADGARYRQVAIEGCKRGFLEDCEISVGDKKLETRRQERQCTITGWGCDTLAHQLARHADIRDALEHACQFREPNACVALANGYRDHRFEEPVVGRLAALNNFICDGQVFEPAACTMIGGK